MRTKKDFDHQNEYNRAKYDRVGIMLPKGKAEEWKTQAKAEGLSLNAWIIKAVNFYATLNISRASHTEPPADEGASLSTESEAKGSETKQENHTK